MIVVLSLALRSCRKTQVTLGHFREIKEAVDANGRAPQGREVVSAHKNPLQRASWLRAAPDTTSARLLARAHQAPGRHKN